MENSVAVVTLTLLIVPLGATFPTTECPCGYGGLCLNIGGISCDACEDVSNGWYETDCYTIANHCESNKCNKGKCVPTFGGYYCECPIKYSGLKCEIFDGNATIKASNRVSIHYQLQPKPTGSRLFTVAYDAEESEFDKWDIEWNINITDGRRYYPGRRQFVRRNIYEYCVEDAKLYPALLDLRICEFLPKHSVLTFSFDAYLSIPRSYPEGLMFAPGLTEAIGRTGKVSIELRASMNGNMTVLHLRNYTLFTYYYHLRMPNSCFLEIIFGECSTIDKYPVHHPRGEKIGISAIKSHSNCDGARVLKKSWYHQSHAEGGRDPVPKLMEGEDDLVLLVPELFMRHGTHMFLFEYTLQGNPPHFGGTTVFTKTGHCWIWSEMGALDVHLKGGDERTSSCLTPLEIPFENNNRNMDLSEMTFSVRCNRKEDPECNLTVSEVPVLIRKRRPVCGSIYVYIIKIVDALFRSTSIRAIIKFVPLNIEVGITCAHNCNPIDPTSRAIWVAYTLPYIQGPVTWSVTVGVYEEQYEHEKLPVQSFYPAKASRIFVMPADGFGGSIFTDIVNVEFWHGSLHAKKSTEILNLALIIQFFVLEPLREVEGIRYKYRHAGFYRPKMYMKYTVFMIDQVSFGAVNLLTTDYEDFLEFSPYWETACLCAQNLDFTFACTTFTSVEINKKAAETPNITELSELLTLGRVGHFLRRADYLFWKYVVPSDEEACQWRMSVKDRSSILKLVQQVISIHTLQVDLITIMHMHSMLFYSNDGNHDEKLPVFKEETFSDNSIASGVEWLALRHEALKSLLNIAETIEYQSKTERYKNLLHFPFGNCLELFMRTSSLAHSQVTTYQHFFKSLINSMAFNEELQYISFKNRPLWNGIMKSFLKSVANYMVLYDGVTTYGVNHAKLWSINDSYAGLLHALNRSDEGGELKIFGSNLPGPHWFSKVSIELPPTPYLLQYKELTLTVVALRSQKYDGQVSSSLSLLLRTRKENYLKRLPDNLTYRITQPMMKDGNSWNVTADTVTKFNDSIERREIANEHIRRGRLFFFRAYKLTFPSVYKEFQLNIFQSRPIPLKVKVDLGRVPDYDEVLDSPELNLERDELFTYVTKVKIHPKPGETELPKIVYLGVLPSSKLPFGDMLDIFFLTTLLVCKTQDLHNEEYIEHCQTVMTETTWKDSEVICDCRTFGVTAAIRLELRVSKFLMADDPFSFVYNRPDSAPYLLFESMLLLALAALFLVTALIYDVKRRRKHSLIYSPDCYRSDKSLLIIGVYTGHRFGAGTISTAAVQLSGQKGYSKVILLKPTKSTDPKTLQRGNDDWFVVTTREHLGRINAVHVWLNFHCSSPWYCDQILICDYTTYRWFRAEVKRWFKIPDLNDESRVATYGVQEYQTAGDLSLDFINNFAIELENTHHALSILTMHPRLLNTYEQRAIIYVLKGLTMSCWIWFALEMMFDLSRGKYKDSQESELLIDIRGDVFLLAVFVSLMSTLSVVPMESLYRFGYLSKIIQRKTTNPLHVDTARDFRVSQHFNRTSGSRNLDTNYSGMVSHQSLMTNLTNVNMQKSTRGNVCSWGFFKAMYLTPSQFYVVNATANIMDFKMRNVNNIARLASIITMLALYATILYLLWGMSFTLTPYTSVSLAVMSVIVDALIVNPILILIRSLVMFYLLKVSNKEVFILSEETKIIPQHNIPHLKYLTMATGRDYKPLLSTEIQKLKVMEIRKRFAMETLFFTLGVAAAVLCVGVFNKTNDRFVFYGIRAMSQVTANHEVKHGSFLFLDKGIKAVNGINSASSYIARNFLSVDTDWYSGKLRFSNRGQWARDDNSLVLDASLTLFVLMANSTTLRLPDYFKEYYSTAFGSLSEGDLNTQPLIVDGVSLHYAKVCSGSLRAKSGEYYAFEGNRLSLELTARNKANIRYTLETLDSKISILPLRAMIISVNYINLFTKHVFTVYLLVEFHHSGICSAIIKINGTLVKSKAPYRPEFFFLLVICISFLIIISVSLHQSYLDGLWRKILAVIILFIVLVVTYKDYKRRYKTIDRIKYNAVDIYLDLHEYHEKRLYTALSLTTFPCLVVLHTVWVIGSVIGTSSFYKQLLSNFHKTISVYLFGIILGQIINICYYNETELTSFMMAYYSKSTKHVKEERKLLGTIFVILIILVLHKVCLALIAYQYFYGKTQPGIDRSSVFVRLMGTFQTCEPGKVAFKKNRAHRHSAIVREKRRSSEEQRTDKFGSTNFSPDQDHPSAGQFQRRSFPTRSVMQKKFLLFDDKK